MKTLLLLALIDSASAKTCVPARETIEHPRPELASDYVRVHPSGDYVLHSGQGVHILKFEKAGADGRREVRVYETPMMDETAPVDEDWEFIASPNHGKNGENDPGGEMRYYAFATLLRDQKKAQKVFSDPEHNEFYHTAYKHGVRNGIFEIRTMLFNDRKYRDYGLRLGPDGKVAKLVKSKIKEMCANFDKPWPKAKADRFRELEPQIVAEKNRIGLETRSLVSKLQKSGLADLGEAEKALDADLKLMGEGLGLSDIIKTDKIVLLRYLQWKLERHPLHQEFSRLANEKDETVFKISEPILSKNGRLLAGKHMSDETKGETTHLWKVDEKGSCTLVKDLGYPTNKVSFSFPEARKLGRIAFTTSATNVNPGDPSNKEDLFVMDLDSGETKKVSLSSETPWYPGFTRDGRLVYKTTSTDGTSEKEKASFIIADLHQVFDGKPARCSER